MGHISDYPSSPHHLLFDFAIIGSDCTGCDLQQLAMNKHFDEDTARSQKRQDNG